MLERDTRPNPTHVAPVVVLWRPVLAMIRERRRRILNTREGRRRLAIRGGHALQCRGVYDRFKDRPQLAPGLHDAIKLAVCVLTATHEGADEAGLRLESDEGPLCSAACVRRAHTSVHPGQARFEGPLCGVLHT